MLSRLWAGRALSLSLWLLARTDTSARELQPHRVGGTQERRAIDGQVVQGELVGEARERPDHHGLERVAAADGSRHDAQRLAHELVRRQQQRAEADARKVRPEGAREREANRVPLGLAVLERQVVARLQCADRDAQHVLAHLRRPVPVECAQRVDDEDRRPPHAPRLLRQQHRERPQTEPRHVEGQHRGHEQPRRAGVRPIERAQLERQHRERETPRAALQQQQHECHHDGALCHGAHDHARRRRRCQDRHQH